MLLTGNKTVVVNSTDIKRKYQDIKKFLNNNMLVIVTNRNNIGEKADGIFIPYNSVMVSKLEDILEDLEMEKNREVLKKELKKSYNFKRKERISLSEL